MAGLRLENEVGQTLVVSAGYVTVGGEKAYREHRAEQHACLRVIALFSGMNGYHRPFGGRSQ